MVTCRFPTDPECQAQWITARNLSIHDSVVPISSVIRSPVPLQLRLSVYKRDTATITDDTESSCDVASMTYQHPNLKSLKRSATTSERSAEGELVRVGAYL